MSKVTLAVALVLVGSVTACVVSGAPDVRMMLDSMMTSINLDAKVSYISAEGTTKQFNFQTDGIKVLAYNEEGMQIIRLFKRLEDAIFTIILWYKEGEPQNIYLKDVAFNATAIEYGACSVRDIDTTFDYKMISFVPRNYKCLGDSQVMADVDIKKFKFEFEIKV